MRNLLTSQFSLKSVIPILVLALVAVGLVTLVALTGRDPVVRAVTPSVARPGDQLVIEGQYLGSDHGSVYIAGIEVPTSSVSLWSDERIELTVPRGTDSGLLFVSTDGGRSQGVLVQMETSVPRSDDVSYRPGTPQIYTLRQTEAEVGTILVIEGENFGPYRRLSRVLFSSQTDSGLTAPEPASVSYPVWTDDSIHVRVPAEAQSGFVSVDTEWGRSNPMRLRIVRPAGELVRTDRTEIAVRYGVGVSRIVMTEGYPESPGAADVVVWLPELASDLGQANVRYLESARGEPSGVSGSSVRSYRYEASGHSVPSATELTVVADRYGLSLEIDPSRVSPVYEGESGFFTYFTRPGPGIPSDTEPFQAIAAQVRRNRASPYQIARAAYDWVLNHMDVALHPVDRSAAAGLQQAYGDDYTYATLFVAVLRAARVPSRLVGGILLSGSGDIYPHFWAEFFVAAVGWIPVDPFLGDGGFPARFAEPDSPKDFYFGNLDSQRLAFNRGYAENGPGQRDGFQVVHPDPLSAQRTYVEFGPALEDFEIEWFLPRLISSRPWDDLAVQVAP